MKRLTDDDVYKHLKHNCEKLAEIGIEPDMAAKRYIKLAEYEQEDERTVALGIKLTLDGAKTIKALAEQALDEYKYKGRTIREWADVITEMNELN